MSILQDFEYTALSALVPEHVCDDVIAWAESVRTGQHLLESVLERETIVDRNGDGLIFLTNPECTAASETEQ